MQDNIIYISKIYKGKTLIKSNYLYYKKKNNINDYYKINKNKILTPMPTPTSTPTSNSNFLNINPNPNTWIPRLNLMFGMDRENLKFSN